jgi:hypothetical protein
MLMMRRRIDAVFTIEVQLPVPVTVIDLCTHTHVCVCLYATHTHTRSHSLTHTQSLSLTHTGANSGDRCDFQRAACPGMPVICWYMLGLLINRET